MYFCQRLFVYNQMDTAVPWGYGAVFGLVVHYIGA